MALSLAPHVPRDASAELARGTDDADALQVILSFDVEEHHRIEAAAGIAVSPAQKSDYAGRMDLATRWILDQLGRHDVRATFFVVGEIAAHNPGLVRAIQRAGHEVASHGWDHRRVLAMTPAEFRRDVRQSKDALEQVTSQPVLGYRAPTFSIVRETAWALDVLAEAGLAYDSSIYPVRHDRYGVPAAPRGPFRARGEQHTILELPPATLRLLGANLPMGGGGYFRLFPLLLTRWALRQARHDAAAPVATLYFHPWEFDPGQALLPLGRLNRFRTYVGIRRSRPRLDALLHRHTFVRAIDVAKRFDGRGDDLPDFDVAGDRRGPDAVRLSELADACAPAEAG